MLHITFQLRINNPLLDLLKQDVTKNVSLILLHFLIVEFKNINAFYFYNKDISSGVPIVE